jgi:hypothetical protein
MIFKPKNSLPVSLSLSLILSRRISLSLAGFKSLFVVDLSFPCRMGILTVCQFCGLDINDDCDLGIGGGCGTSVGWLGLFNGISFWVWGLGVDFL